MKFLQMLLSLFKKKATPAPTAKPVEPPKAQEPVPPVSTKKKVPTRDEMNLVVKGFVDGTIPTRVGPYSKIKEIKGKNNRSDQIDSINKAQGGSLADPYCQAGMQETLDEQCRYYDIDRKKVNIPEGVGTQDVWRKTPAKYKTNSPQPCMWVNWKHTDNPGRGHTGLTITGVVKKIFFNTMEFNTTAAGQKVVRDGEGFYYGLERDLDGYGDAVINGFIDVYAAIVDAMIASGEYEA